MGEDGNVMNEKKERINRTRTLLEADLAFLPAYGRSVAARIDPRRSFCDVVGKMCFRNPGTLRTRSYRSL